MSVWNELGVTKWLMLGVPIIFVFGSIFHFLYDWSGQNFFVGLIAPINESVWEHTKMVLLPMMFWWGFVYIKYASIVPMDRAKWLSSLCIAILSAMIVIPLLFYFYTEAFGVELLWVDILILLIAVYIGQWLGVHWYQYGVAFPMAVSYSILVGMLLVYMLFTVAPPKLPMFQDPLHSTFGIQKWLFER